MKQKQRTFIFRYGLEDGSIDRGLASFDEGIDAFLEKYAAPNTPPQRHLSTAILPANDVTSALVVTVMLVYTPKDGSS